MTEKYFFVRRDMVEKKPKIKLKRNKPALKELFAWPLWLAFGTIIILYVMMFFILIKCPTSPCLLIPIIGISGILGTLQLLDEKYLYNQDTRKENLQIQKENYQSYLIAITNVLIENDITTAEQRGVLKRECIERLETYKTKNDKPIKQLGSLCFYLPATTVIVQVCGANTVDIQAVTMILIAGFLLAAFFFALHFFRFYTEAYFKDQYLLDTLIELEYCPSSNKKHGNET